MKLSQTIQTSDGVLVPAGVKLEFSGGKAKYQNHPIERRLVPLQAIVGAKGPFLRACCATVINDCRRFQSEVRKTNYADWAHCIVDGDNIIVYIWDTRQVIDVIPGLHAGANGGPVMRHRNLVSKQTGERLEQHDIIGHNRWGWAKSFYEMLMLPQYHRLDNGLPLVTDRDEWQVAIANINKQAQKAQAAYESCNVPVAATETFFGSNGNGVFVFKYTEVASWFRNLSMPKAEPWMHLGIVTLGKKYAAVVWIWDTRKVLGECELDEATAKKILDNAIRMRCGAIDSNQKLKGGGEFAALANRVMR